MSKRTFATNVAPVDELNVASVSDLGYQQARNGDKAIGLARIAIERIAGFPDSLPDEDRASLFEGYRRRYDENHPAVMHAVIDGHYVIATPEHIENKKIEKVSLGVAYAFSFTAQEFGKMRESNPALHAVIKPWRDKVSDYCTGALSALKSQAKKILNEGKKRDRAANRDFAEYLNATFESMRTRCKTAKARGDNAANETRLSEAIIAFNTAWNK